MRINTQDIADERRHGYEKQDWGFVTSVSVDDLERSAGGTMETKYLVAKRRIAGANIAFLF